MARLKIFISSTYYDLKSIRADLDRQVRELGHDPVRFEVGHIPFGSDASPEIDCYREISNCDVLICIIGGVFGSASSDGSYSITQRELKTAHEEGKQIYIFVDKPVNQEFQFYKANKNIDGITFTSVNNKKIFEFLEEIYGLNKGNPIFPFETSHDIGSILREQLSGLFQRLIKQHSAVEQVKLSNELKDSLATVNKLIEVLLANKDAENKDIIKEILTANHPVFKAIGELLGVSFRCFFSSRQELTDALADFRFKIIDIDPWDADGFIHFSRRSVRKNRDIHGKANQTIIEVHKIRISEKLFDDDGALIPSTATKWTDEWITSSTETENDEEIPF